MLVILCLVAYLCLLCLIGKVVGSRGGNEVFFVGKRTAPWLQVSIGMVGASISGVTFVSVPGMVVTENMAYLQLCLGFPLGYLLVAKVLLPLYYRLRLTTIYTLLQSRLGKTGYKAGAVCFLVSSLTGQAVRFYLVAWLLQTLVFDALGLPFCLTVPVLLAFVWLYTKGGGIRTLVFTDVVQTLVIVAALVVTVCQVLGALDMDFLSAVRAVSKSGYSQIFVFNEPQSPNFFFKQFLSGVFIVVVMTGLDQNMMQKNLTCRSLRESQKNMELSGWMFVPVNLVFLFLGVLLVMLFSAKGVPLPQQTDALLPLAINNGWIGGAAMLMFVLGLTAASLSSVDSAITAMTTSVCVDLLNNSQSPRLRRRAHILVTCLLCLVVLLVDSLRSKSVIDAIYTLCSYTYGPLLALFTFAICFNRRRAKRSMIILSVALSPVLSWLISQSLKSGLGYSFGYELLLLNAAIGILILLCRSTKNDRPTNQIRLVDQPNLNCQSTKTAWSINQKRNINQ